MNYTTGPRSLIYRDKRNLDDFVDANELNAALIKNMAEIEELLNSDFEQHALICMNAAYYICTIFMLEKHPIWRLSGIDSFICKLNMHPVEEYKKIIFSLVYLMLKHYNKNWQDNNKDLLKGIYVCIYPEYKNARVIMDVSIEGHPSDIKQTLEAKLPPNFVLPDDEFVPRIIDKEAVNDALSEKGFSWVKFVNYFEERSVRDVVKAYGSTEEEKHNVVDLLRQVSQGFYTAGFNDYPEKVDKMLNDIDKEISLEFNPNAEQEKIEEDRTELITPIDLAPYDAQIKELKEENTDLKNTIAELQQPVEEMPAVQKVRMELVFQLLKKAGLTDDVLQQQNNKQKVATIMSILLDIHNKNKKGNEAQTCATYLSARDLSRSRHEETINKINALLKELNIDVQI